MAHYFGDALSEIKKIKGKADGHLDFDTMPVFAKKMQEKAISKVIKNKDGKEEFISEIVMEEGRDLGAMISMLTVAVQQLLERIEILEKK